MKVTGMLVSDKGVSLRAIRMDDAAAISLLANNREVSRHLRDVFPYPYQLTDARFFIELALGGKLGYVWVIEWNETLTGVLSLQPQADVYRHSVEIGYWLGQPFWGRGIASSGVSLACAHAFEELGLHRIYAGIFAPNIASMKVLERNGFVREGIRQLAILKDGELHDEHLFALLKQNYAAADR